MLMIIQERETLGLGMLSIILIMKRTLVLFKEQLLE